MGLCGCAGMDAAPWTDWFARAPTFAERAAEPRLNAIFNKTRGDLLRVLITPTLLSCIALCACTEAAIA